MAETMKNPAVTVMLGPGYGLDNTDGAMMSHFMLLYSCCRRNNEHIIHCQAYQGG